MNTEDRVNRLVALDDRLLYAAELATEVAIKKLEDPKTPASALAAIIGQVFRANGLHEGRNADQQDIEPHEMTADELTARLKTGEKRLEMLRHVMAERAIPVIDAVAGHGGPAVATPPTRSVFE